MVVTLTAKGDLRHGSRAKSPCSPLYERGTEKIIPSDDLLHYSGVNLNRRRKSLIPSDLKFARLHHTNLIGADLTGADLRFADLLGATFITADLTGADVTGVTNARHDFWSWADHGPEKTNWGLVTSRDNAYDGKEATIALGHNRWDYPTGGEKADYGDFLTAITAVNQSAYRELGLSSTNCSGGSPDSRSQARR